MSETQDPMVAALLREREGYVAFGRADRVEAVDAELKRRGYEPEKPRGRSTREQRQQTADQPGFKHD